MPKINLTYTFDNEDELRAHIGGVTATPVAAAPAPAAPAEEPEMRNDADTDSDGMPYDPEVHTETRATNQDGTWKARKGKAAEAKAARAAFKAGGGDAEAPDVEERTEESVAATGMPGMPGTIPAETPEPVSMERVIDKANGMMERKVVDQAGIGALYVKAGSTTLAEYESNETLRAKLFDLMCELEPELA